MRKKGETRKVVLSLIVAAILGFGMIAVAYAASSQSSDDSGSSLWDQIVAFFTGGNQITGATAATNAVCGQTIYTSLQLDGDLLNCPGNGLTIGASNIILDCAGHSITGYGTGKGVVIIGTNSVTVDGVTVENCEIHDFQHGIYVTAFDGGTTTDALITNNLMSRFTEAAIWLYHSSSIIVTNNVISDGGKAGIMLYGDTVNSLINKNDITFSAYTGAGIRLGTNPGASYNTISENNITSLNGHYSINIAKAGNTGNMIYYNNFDDKSNDIDGGNIWDDGNCAGNYWGTGLVINGGMGATDKYPLAQAWPDAYDTNSNGVADCGDCVGRITVTRTTSTHPSLVNCDGVTCTVQQDITFCDSPSGYPDSSLVINEDNVVLECNSHTLTGPGAGITENGIFTNGMTGVTIQNCIVTNFDSRGMYLANVDDISVLGNTVKNSKGNFGFGYCIQVYGSNSIISGNTVENCKNGFDFTSSIALSNSEVSNNIAKNNTRSIGLGGNNNIVRDNTILTSNTGIYLIGASNTILKNNIDGAGVTYNPVGIQLYGASATNNIIKENTIQNTIYSTVEAVNGATNNYIYYNNLYTNGDPNARDRVGNNQWDDGTCAGNYWAENCASSDGEFCDSPHVYTYTTPTSSTTLTDNYPLAKAWPDTYDTNNNGVADCADCVDMIQVTKTTSTNPSLVNCTGGTCTVQQDITFCDLSKPEPWPYAGIFIKDNDVILDCNGHTLKGAGNGHAVFSHVSWSSGITMKNCVTDNWDYGYLAKGGQNNTITNNEVKNSYKYGIRLDNTLHSEVSNNDVHDNRVGVSFQTPDPAPLSACNIIVDNNIYDNAVPHGSNLELHNSTDAYIAGNTLSGSLQHALTIRSTSSGNVFVDNNIVNNGDNSVWDYAISIEAQAAGNKIYHNNLYNNNAAYSINNPNNVWDDGVSAGNYWAGSPPPDATDNYPLPSLWTGGHDINSERPATCWPCSPTTPVCHDGIDNDCDGNIDETDDEDNATVCVPLAEYKFDSCTGTTATDSSGNGKHGTLRGSVVRTGGYLNQGVEFDYDYLTNDTVTTPGLFSASIPYGASGAVWFRYDGPTDKWESTIFEREFSNFDLSVLHNPNEGPGQIRCRITSKAVGQKWTALYPVNVGQWYHAACVYDKDTDLLTLYVNGNPFDSITANFDEFRHGANKPFGIGGRPAQVSWTGFDGIIDEVSFYEYALSASDVAALAIAPANPVGCCFDNDGDTYYGYDVSSCPSGDDCDDTDPNIKPGAPEVCNGVDDDCNTVIDDGGNALCDDNLACTGVEICAGFALCQPGTPVDCSGDDILGIATCNNNPDLNPDTWDYREAFTSTCQEPSGTCTQGNPTITFTCDATQCTAECDANSVWQDYCAGDERRLNGYCDTSTTSCSWIYSTEDCNLQDEWVDTGNTREIPITGEPCDKMLQKEQVFHDYTCGAGVLCTYTLGATQWVDVQVIDYDEDNDDVCNDADKCGSNIPENPWFAEVELKLNHYDNLNWAPSTANYGCSCAQVLYCKPGGNNGEYKFGCSQGTKNIWEAQSIDSWALDCQVNGVVTEGEPKPLFENTDDDWVIDILDGDNDNDGTPDSDDDMIEDSDPPGTPGHGKPDWWEKAKGLK